MRGEVEMRVLIVEDEADLADVVARGLRQAGLAVNVAWGGEEALEKATVTPYSECSLVTLRSPV